MHNVRVKPIVFISLIILITITACGSKGTPEAAATPTTVKQEPTKPVLPTETTAPAGLVSSLPDLKKATVQIVAEGTFVDPELGYMANTAGSGSGFIIDPSGIAITNNHVVTGAALLKVLVGGDKDKVYNARILGVSECSDLAVIDIEGDGLPYLAWSEQPTTVGLEVYAAGYPLGDPEFTMTEGIVSKQKANGDTSWASVDSVLEHTATINPGNSGGPLVDASANVVGINYAGSSSTNQYYAIDRGTAIPVIEKLRLGEDVESIGINGQAVSSEDGSITGVWVSSVESGSPADKSGVQAGDIITSLENLYLATDGTMKDYCDILRTRNPQDTMAIEVLRWNTQEVLKGQLNGRELAVAYSLGSPAPTEAASQQATSTVTGSTLPSACVASTTSGYMTCTDDNGILQVDVPDTWTDFNGGNWTYEGETIGVAISAAPNLADFQNSFFAEGMFYGASDTFAQYGGYVQFLDAYTETYRSDCHLVGRFDYNDTVYKGKFDQYSDCGGTGGYDAYVLSAVDIVDQFSKVILIEVQTYPGDTDVVNQIFGTFYVFF